VWQRWSSAENLFSTVDTEDHRGNSHSPLCSAAAEILLS
jgi:hypothetical protein